MQRKLKILPVFLLTLLLSTSSKYDCITVEEKTQDSYSFAQKEHVYNIRAEELLQNTEECVVTQPSPEPQKIECKVTAYTLSKSECGKYPWEKGYGISRGGEDLRGKTWDTARIIAVDPNVIPLGTKVKLEFHDEKYKKYEGIYTSNDTGSGINGNKIDLFISENGRHEALEFGITECTLTIIE